MICDGYLGQSGICNSWRRIKSDFMTDDFYTSIFIKANLSYSRVLLIQNKLGAFRT